MNDLKKAAQQALEALEAIDEDPHGTHSFPALSNDAITALRAALEQQEKPIRPTVQEMQNAAANLKLMEKMFGGSTALEQPKPTRAQQMRDAGYTRMPTLREMVEQEQEPVAWTDRELELIDGMIEVQLRHAAQCDGIANRTMAEKQKGWDMERVALLHKIKSISPRCEWQSLTDKEIIDAVRESDLDWQRGWTLEDSEPNRYTQLARAIEAALKEKNQ
jgi:hypothetical protein